MWGVGGVEIPAGMALERVWQCDILKGKIQGGGMPACRLGTLQFVAKFATGRNRKEG